MRMRSKTTQEILETKRTIDSDIGCWLWTGCATRGYGQIIFGIRLCYVHRVAAHIYLGFDLSSPLQVMHKCDRPLCFNPEHLTFGTSKENMQDALHKGRILSWRGRNLTK